MGKRIHVSRDVVFEETKGWSWAQQEDIDSGNLSSFSVPEFLEGDGSETVVEEMSDVEETGGDEFMTPPRTQESGDNITENSPLSQISGTNLSSDRYDDSREPRKFRPLSEIYADAEEVEVDQELLMVESEEPHNYEQVVKEINWRLAMDEEIASIKRNDTWGLTKLPNGHKVIDLKWFFKLKKNENGEIVKYKARLVAKGYVQEHSVEYDEVYAPVTRLETVRLLLALAAKNDWRVHHLDVKTAFLNGDINEEVYVAHPKGYIKEG